MITGVSISGLVLGVAIICIVLSVLNGFRAIVSDLFLTIETETEIIPLSGKYGVFPDSLLTELKEERRFQSAERFISTKVLMLSQKQSAMVTLKAVSETSLQNLSSQFIFGHNNLSPYGIAIGVGVSRSYSLEPNEPIRLLTPELVSAGLEALENPFLPSVLQPPAFTIENVFSSHRLYDDATIVASLKTVQDNLSLKPFEASGVAVRFQEGNFGRFDFEAKRRYLQSWLEENGYGNRFRATGLDEKHEALFRVMKLEKWGSFAILLLAVLIASLSLIGSLTMTAIEKRRDLFILSCTGLGNTALQLIFVMEGCMVAFIGICGGILVSALILYLQIQFGLIRLPYSEGFIISSYPVFIEYSDFIVVILATLFISILASLYPAYKAKELSLRYAKFREDRD
ncbi:MAG: FtsX-like permease family protein [Chloroherpetonaceae bacterium]|nr:FtsX-like permease family protein [Chloroherpetonaceae bacterium]